MRSPANELVFLPGFDGAAELRHAFLGELRRHYRVCPIGYPHRPLGGLDAYRDYAAATLAPDARPILVAESFSGLVAARWAARDARIAALVLCGSFARNPVRWAAPFGASFPHAVKLGASLLGPMSLSSGSVERRSWARALSATLTRLPAEVIAERLRLIATADVSKELAALQIPIVLLQFEADLVIGPQARRELERVCHNAQVVRVAGPHFAIETLPRECAAAIRTRIASLG